MSRTCALSAAALLFVEALAVRGAAAEDVKGTFLGSMTYLRVADCDNAKQAVASGMSPSGDILDAGGLGDSDFHCFFVKVEEREAAHVWAGQMSCSDDEEDWDETDTFEKNAADGSFKVTMEGGKEPVVFVPCYTK